MMSGFLDEFLDSLGFCMEMEVGGCLGVSILSLGIYISKSVEGRDNILY